MRLRRLSPLLHVATLVAAHASAQGKASLSAGPPSQAPISTAGLTCSHFDWKVDADGQNGYMIIPISLNGHPYRFQLDTGADAVITYGKVSHQDWRPYGDRALRIPNVQVAGFSFPAILAYPLPSMDDKDVQGTVGLDLFMGLTLIIDLPAQRVCLLQRADLPLAFEQNAFWLAGDVVGKSGKFFVSATLNGIRVPRLLYDSGSSPATVDLDLSLWKGATGRASTSGTPMSKPYTSWGKPLHNIGAPAVGDLVFNGFRDPPKVEQPTTDALAFHHPMVTTTIERPDYYHTQLDGDGVLGNALFLEDILVLDLGAHPRFGIISPQGR